MYRLRELLLRLLAFRHRVRREADLDRELAVHVQMAIDDRVREGLTPAEARRAALQDLGGLPQTREAFREQQSLPGIETILRDVAYAWRLMRARPSFAVTALLAIGLGIGANAAVFSVAYSVLWRPLPFDQPHRLVRLYQTKSPASEMPVSPLNFLDWARFLRSVDAIAAWRGATYTVASIARTTNSKEERQAEFNDEIPGAQVTASIFDVLHVQPVLGRAFTAEDDSPSGQAVAVISDRLWRARFGASPDVIGQSVTAGKTVYTIVGVLPPGVSFPSHGTAIWTPLRIGDPSHRMQRTENYLGVLARLARGITLDAAQEDANRLALLLAAEYPADNAGVGILARSLHESVTGSARTPLVMLMAMAGSLLLISCANVAYLLLARAMTREGELTLRAALGATRSRLVRQSLTESLLLAAGGCALGLTAAVGVIELLRPALPPSLPRRQEIGFDIAVIAYALACAAVVCVIAGTAPAIRAWRVRLDERLQQSRQTSSRRTGIVGRAAVVVQVTLSLVLLVATLLTVQSLRNVLSVDSGFVPHDVAVTTVAFPGAFSRELVVHHFERVVDEVGRVPGVASSGLVNHVPLSLDGSGTRFTLEHRATRSEDVHMAAYRVVSPTYFPTVGARLIRGRHFAASDRPDGPFVVIVNDAMARRYWPAQDPVGSRIRRGGIDSTMPYATVVGVVADMKQDALDREVKPEIFIPHAQFPWPVMSLVVRTSQSLDAIAPALRTTLTRVNGTPSSQAIQPFDELIWATVRARAFTSTLLLLFAILAAAVAMLGVYAVAGHVTAARTKELAIRSALGAPRGSVVDAAVGTTLRLVLIGLLLGTAGAYTAARAVSTLLFGIAPFDPLTYLTATVLLGVIAVVAVAGPARRALIVDPVMSLRAE